MSTFYKILPLLIILIVSALVIKFLFPLWYKFKLKRITRARPVILIEDKNGFVIYTTGKPTSNVKWKEIDKIEMAGTQNLQLLFKNKTTLSLQEKEYIGWLSVVRAIPSNFPVNNTLSNFISSRFSNLSCCSICGKIAVKNDECLNCINDSYDKYCKQAESFGEEIKTERNFIRENQLEWFTDFIEGPKVDFYTKDLLYDDCPGWTPSVNAFEVIKHQKKLEEDDAS
jgi:hypothetical protein